MPIPRILQSSADPASVSLTIKGALVALIPVAITVARLKGVELAEDQVVHFIDEVARVGAAIALIFGFARKVYHWVKAQR